MIWPFGSGADDLDIHMLGVDHAAHAAAIHAATFARPWTDGELGDLVAQDNVIGFAAFAPAGRGAGMVGFVLARQAADEAEILTIAVRPDWQRSGVGRRLLDHLLAAAHHERVDAIFLEVDETNAAARALYARRGFRIVAERPDYYLHADAGRSRALVMRRDPAPARPRA